MKNKLLLFVLTSLLMACGERNLSQDEAKVLLTKQGGYPKAYTFSINRIDPESVRRLDAAGLENAGMVRLKKSWTLAEVAEPKITFTDQAKPFLQGPSKGETAKQSEEVKIADMDITKIVGIATSADGKTAKVEYLVSYTNLSPFKVLIKRSLETPESYTEYFRLFDDGWRIDKSAAINMQP